MTEQQHKQVVEVLTRKIRANNGSMMLNQVSPTLGAAGIDRAIYDGLGPKRWLTQYFPQFSIEGTNGTEMVLLAPLTRVEDTLRAALDRGETVLFSAIPQMLREQCHVDYRDYAEGKGLQQWLLSVLPQFARSEDGLALTLAAPAAEPADPCAEEVRQMYAFAFMGWWNSNLKQLHAWPEFADVGEAALRTAVAHSLARALLDPAAGMIHALREDPPRLAFPSGLTARDGTPLYCILGLNPRNEDGTRQVFALEGFAMPTDGDERGGWLARHLVCSTRQTAAPDYEQLAARVESLRQLREQLVPLADACLAALKDGTAPAASLAQPLALYEQLWEELSHALGELPDGTLQRPFSLESLALQLNARRSCTDLLPRAARAFAALADGAARLYADNHLGDPGTSAPGSDQRLAADLLAGTAGEAGIARLRERLAAYRSLRTVMQASTCADAENDIDEVTRQFPEISYRFAARALIGSAPEETAFLSGLEEISGLLDQYVRFRRNAPAQEDAASRMPDADALLEEMLRTDGEAVLRRPGRAAALLPEDADARALVLGGEDSPVELTFYAAACRLLEARGNRDRLAERYLLLGLPYDAARCVPALLQLFREENRTAGFDALWERYAGELTFRDEDLACWLSFRCAGRADGDRLDNFEEFLSKRPWLLRSDRFRDSLRGLTPRTDLRPAAFWAWLGLMPVTLNPFESAVASNDVDLIYASLDDAGAMARMGYSPEETAAIRAVLQQGIPGEMDTYSKALRLLAVQQNKNRAAEQLLWNASSNAKAQYSLFDLYYAGGDHASVCWIARHFSLSIRETDDRADAFLHSLTASGETGLLDSFVRHHPALCHRPGVLAALAGAEKDLPEEQQHWTPLFRQDQLRPMVQPCPFELALTEGDLTAAQHYLSDTDAMAQWGYSPELQQQAAQALQNPALFRGQDLEATAARIRAVQGNLHRCLEQYLYRMLGEDMNHACQQLFELLYDEQRYAGAAAYYEAYAFLRSSEQNTVRYLWSLLRLGRYDRLLEQASANPRCLQWNADLAEAFFPIAEEYGDPDETARIRRFVNLQPRNRFEESIIHLNVNNLQQLISDPSQLLELGYSREQINHFKECLSKPYPGGSDPFSVGNRVRSFLGDERAEPFLLDCESDPRSARILFDIYSKQKRWDDQCLLFRRHQEGDVWNNHFQKLYTLALSRAVRPENCRAFLDLVTDNPQIDPNNAEVRWLCLRARLGMGCTVEELVPGSLILAGEVPFKQQIAAGILDLLWDRGGDARRTAVLLAARLFTACKDHLSLEEMKFLASVGGHLTAGDACGSWAEFLSRNVPDDFLWLLNCCGSDPDTDPERAARIGLSLEEKLGAAGRPLTPQELTLYTDTLSRLSALPQDTLGRLSGRLLQAWEPLLSPRADGFDRDAWAMFAARMGSLVLTAGQYRHIEELWQAVLSGCSAFDEQLDALVCGGSLFVSLHDAGSEAADALAAMTGLLADAWADAFAPEHAIREDAWQSFLRFWKRADLSDAQLARFDAAWGARLEACDPPRSEFFNRITCVMGSGRPAYLPGFLAPLIRAMAAWLQSGSFADDAAGWEPVCRLIRSGVLSHDQMGQLMDALALPEYFANEDLCAAVQTCCVDRWPDLAYRWKKLECQYFDGEDTKRAELLQQLLDLSGQLEDAFAFDPTDRQLLYEAACKNLSPQALRLLRRAWSGEPDSDRAAILDALVAGDWQGEHPEALEQWFVRALAGHDLDWLRRCAAWWAPLVRLSGEDQQTRIMADFLGLTDDRVGEAYRQSVTRLLMSDINNLSFLKCFLRIHPDLPDDARLQLQYLEVEKDPDQAESIARQFLDHGQYAQAADLLLLQMQRPIANSSVIGQLIGRLYTETSLQACPALRDRIPQFFAGILRMNEADQEGSWKNTGRAVDIACLTGSEEEFFQCFGQAVLREFPGKCCAVIASLVLRHDFAAARRWCDRVLACGKLPYAMLSSCVIDECLKTGCLSRRDELLMRSIPRDGNRRSLEFYGRLTADALARGWQKECAQAFVFLYGMDTSDKALSACCIQMYTADPEQFDTEFLYSAAEQYFTTAQDTYLLRVASMLAILHSLLPDDAAHGSVVTFCMQRIGAEHGAALSELMALETHCRDFLASGQEHEERREILLRAATGWWRMDERVCALIAPWKDLLRRLITVYPASFLAACFRAALLRRGDTAFRKQLRDMMLESGREARLTLCARRLDCVDAISPDRADAMARLLDLPIELPWLYPCLFDPVLQNDRQDQVLSELTLLFSVQPNFSYRHYSNNLYRLKERVEEEYPQYQDLLSQVFANMMVADSGTERLKPDTFLNRRDYLMTYKAACAQLDSLNSSSQPSRFFQALNQYYRLLGQLMTGQLTEEEINALQLSDLMNMANLLCQGGAYPDLSVLFDLCPNGYWKVCLRSVQELIQGCPSDVMELFRHPDFAAQSLYAAHVGRLVSQFVTASHGGQNLLAAENARFRRIDSWGIIPRSSLSGLPTTNHFLLPCRARNPVELSPFLQDVESLLNTSLQDSDPTGTARSSPESGAEAAAAVHSFKTVPYVLEQAERWLNADKGERDEDDAGTDIRQAREQLTNRLNAASSDAERVDLYGQLIALEWNSGSGANPAPACIGLGLSLFNTLCQTRGMAVYATPKARKVLYEMAAFLPGTTMQRGMAESIRTDLLLCLTSYTDLSELVNDCSQSPLLTLCSALTDRSVRQDLEQHIRLVREIGSRMGEPMTNTERLDWLKDCVTRCQASRSTFTNEVCQQLILLLNRQILSLQGMARIVLTVYNTTGTIGQGHIFGKIENLGEQSVSNVHMELSIDGVAVQKYTLPQLEGSSMVPFDLIYETGEDRQTLHYGITAGFGSGDGRDAQALPVEGDLRLVDPDDLDYEYAIYHVDTPATRENYTDRANIQKILDALYGPRRSFDSFPNLAIYGMKRTGKTSVLRHLEQMLSDRPQPPLCVETSGEGATGSLTERVHSILVRQVLMRMTPAFRGEAGWQDFCRRWNAVPEESGTPRWDWLDEFYSALSMEWIGSRGLVVLIDEVENLYWSDEDDGLTDDDREETEGGLYMSAPADDSGRSGTSGLWNTLSRITQGDSSMVRFVLCGSDFFINKIIEGDNLTQFFQRIKKLSIGRMDRLELEYTMRAIEQEDCDLKLHPDAIEYLWSLTGGLPWHSKLIANTIIENRLIHEEGAARATIYPSDITWGTDRILTNPISSSDNNYGLAALSADEQVILDILTAGLRTARTWIADPVLRQQFHGAVGDESWENRYERAMKTLVSERQMLARRRTKGEEQYQFGCELYRLYNRRETPEQFYIR